MNNKELVDKAYNILDDIVSQGVYKRTSNGMEDITSKSKIILNLLKFDDEVDIDIIKIAIKSIENIANKAYYYNSNSSPYDSFHLQYGSHEDSFDIILQLIKLIK